MKPLLNSRPGSVSSETPPETESNLHQDVHLGKTISKTGSYDELQTPYLDTPLSTSQRGRFTDSSESLPLSGSTVDDVATVSRWRVKLLDLWDDNKGVLLMILAQFFGAAMAAIARLMETSHGIEDDRAPLNPFQILFARQSITVVLSLAYMYWAKVPEAPLGPRKVRPLLLARGFGGFFGVVGLYFSLLYLPLSDAIVMTFLAPMLAAWVSSLIIKTPFTRTQQVAGIVAIFGVVLITQPFSLARSMTAPVDPIKNGTMTAGQGNTTTASTDDSLQPTPAQRAIAVACGVMGICGAASAYVTISWIGKRAHPLISVTYFSTWCTFVSIVAMLFVPGVGFRMPATIKEWVLLTGLGFSGFVMQFLLTASLAHKRSNKVLNMVYSQVLFALGFDKLLFDETPTLLSWLGSGLILGSVIWIAVKADSEVKAQKNMEVGAEIPVVGDEEIGLVAGMETGPEEHEMSG